MKVVCLDFDDVITKGNIVLKISDYVGDIPGFEDLRNYAEDPDPHKFFDAVHRIADNIKGVDINIVSMLLKGVEMNDGVPEALEEMKRKGYKVVIVSVNDQRLIEEFLKTRSIDRYVDYIYASDVETKDGKLTGKISGSVIDTEKKGIIDIARDIFDASQSDLVYIGDGVTDTQIMKMMGECVLFNPYSAVEKKILEDEELRRLRDQKKLLIVNSSDLRDVLEYV